jgi:hypothetical protein
VTSRRSTATSAAAQLRALLLRNAVGRGIERYLDALDSHGVGSRYEAAAWAGLRESSLRLERVVGALRRRCAQPGNDEVERACRPVAYALARERERIVWLSDARPGRRTARVRRTLSPGWGATRDADLRASCLRYAASYLAVREACEYLARTLGETSPSGR